MPWKPREFRFHPELRTPPTRTRSSPQRPRTKARQGFVGCTPAQDEVLAYIQTALEEGWTPSLEQIRARMGWGRKQSARDCVLRLDTAGRLPEAFDRSELTRRP